MEPMGWTSEKVQIRMPYLILKATYVLDENQEKKNQ